MEEGVTRDPADGSCAGVQDMSLRRMIGKAAGEPGAPTPEAARQYSPLALAFLGDGIYSLVVRSMVLLKGNRPPEKLHRDTSLLVMASRQARIADAIGDMLTDEEAAVFRRGRNADPHHRAKGATAEEYFRATALEALCGYLYLADRMPRLLELICEGIRRTD